MSRVHVVAIGDTHCGSVHGLAMNQTYFGPNDIQIQPSPASLALLDWLDEDLDEAIEHRREARPDRSVLLLMGDLVDGEMHHGTTELYHPGGGVEKQIAASVLDYIVRKLEPDHIVGIRGTPSHVGGQGRKEESLLKALDAEFGNVVPNGEKFTHLLWKPELAGHRLHVQHHGRMGRLEHTRDAYAHYFAHQLWLGYAKYGREAPTVGIFAHRHKWVDTGHAAPGIQRTRVVFNPCYQFGTEWVSKVGIVSPPDIGLTCFTFAEGRPEIVQPFMRSPEPPEAEGWQALPPKFSSS